MRALSKLTWVELKLFIREPLALVFTLAFPIVLLIVLIGSFKPDDTAFGSHLPANYYLASYVGVVIGAIGLVALPVHVASYREQGVLRRFRSGSVPTWVLIGSHLITGLVMATVGGLMLVAAAKGIYGAALPVSPWPVLGAFVLATLAFLAIGCLIGSLARSARAAQSVGMLLFFPMWLLSGAAPPPSVMAPAMRHLSDLLPLTFAVRAIQQPWLGADPQPLYLLLLAGLLVAATGFSARALRNWQ